MQKQIATAAAATAATDYAENRYYHENHAAMLSCWGKIYKFPVKCNATLIGILDFGYIIHNNTVVGEWRILRGEIAQVDFYA